MRALLHVCKANLFFPLIGAGHGTVYVVGGNLFFIHGPMIVLHKVVPARPRKLPVSELHLYFNVGKFDERQGQQLRSFSPHALFNFCFLLQVHLSCMRLL